MNSGIFRLFCCSFATVRNNRILCEGLSLRRRGRCGLFMGCEKPMQRFLGLIPALDKERP